jgi:hypothetical protein
MEVGQDAWFCNWGVRGTKNFGEIHEELCWEGWWGRATIRQRLKRLSRVLKDG